MWYNKTFRLILAQVILVLGLGTVVYWAWSNVQHNLEVRDIQSGFDFLDQSAGFNIIMHLIPYEEASTYGRVFWVGLLNTLLVSAIGIVLATILGFIVGIGRLSNHSLTRWLASAYVETIRNIPLLLQIFFWYFAVLRTLPSPKQSWQIYDSFYLNIRGLYVPHIQWAHSSHLLVYTIIVFVVLLVIGHGHGNRVRALKGDSPGYKKWIAAAFVPTFALVWLVVSPVEAIEYPALRGFNFQGGVNLLPELIALVLALSMYTAAFIAEIVRLGIQSVPHGQSEAAHALGLSKAKAMKLIILPQALKVMLPPLTNQYLNLTKNSSLAAAIAYPDLVSVFAGTVLNQTGQAIEVIGMTMAVYLFISISISLVMIAYEKKNHWGKG